MLLILYFLRILGALSATLLLNLTSLGPYSKPASGSLRLPPLPNPFPIPGTDLTLRWDPAHDLDYPLNRADTEETFRKCKTRADTHVRFIGDGPIGGLIPDYMLSAYGSVAVEFSSAIPGVILYSEVSDVLMAISWKFSREGYRGCWVRVLRTEGGQPLGRVTVRADDLRRH